MSLVQLLSFCLVVCCWLSQGRACSNLIVVDDISHPDASESVLKLLDLVEPNDSLEGDDQSGGLPGDDHLPRRGLLLENDALVVDQILCAVVGGIVRPILRGLQSEEYLPIDVQPGLLAIDLVVLTHEEVEISVLSVDLECLRQYSLVARIFLKVDHLIKGC